MATKLHEETFNTLQHTKHRVNENIAPNLFPTADELNDTEYWLFSDLYNLFGEQYMGTPNKIPDTFLSTINFSEFNKLPATNPDGEKRAPDYHAFYSGHMATFFNDYTLKSPRGTIEKRGAMDAKFTRYACWKILHPWTHTLFAQLYFMTPDATFAELYNASYKYSRIYQRAELAEYNKTINGIANRHHANMREFNASLHRAFFYSTDHHAIMDAYNLTGNILDHMGLLSLSARKSALYRTIRKWDTNKNMSFGQFTNLLYNELVDARVKMIQDTGRAPERDISKQSIQQITRELQQRERAFVNKFAYQHLRQV